MAERLFEALVAALGDILVHAHGVDLVDVPQKRQVIGAGRVVAQGIGGAPDGAVVRGLAGPVVRQDLLHLVGGEAPVHHLVDLHGR